MSAFYTKLAQTARSLLTKFGQPILIHRSFANLDPVTGTVTISSQLEWDAQKTLWDDLVSYWDDDAAELTFAPKGLFQRIPDALVDGARVLSSDRLIIIDGSVEPLMSDLVTVGDEEWPIEEVTAVNPAGVPLTYVLRVRR